MLVNGLAEKMSRVGCISTLVVCQGGQTSAAHFLGGSYNFQREILSVRHQAMVSYDQE